MAKFTRSKTVVVLFIIIQSVGCNSKKTDDTASTTTYGTTVIYSVATEMATPSWASQACVPNVSNTVSNLNGTWTRSCYSISSSAWQTDQIVISGTAFTETVKSYTDPGCPNSSLETTVNTTGTISTVGADLPNKNGINYLEFTVSSVKVTSESFLKTMLLNGNFTSTCGNSSYYCGLTWNTGVVNDVTGIYDCPSGCNFPAAGSTLTQIFALGNRDTGDLTCSETTNGLIIGANANHYNGFIPHGLVLNAISSTPSGFLKDVYLGP